MNEKAEIFFQAMRFTPVWGVVDLLLILHFCFSWYFSAKRTGWKIDFWHLTLLLSIVPALLFLYPFCASPYNEVSTLGHLEKIVPFVDRAFAISILGYCFIWVGRYSFDLTKARLPFIVLALWMRPLALVVESNIKNRRAVALLTWGAALLGLTILAIQFTHGTFFNGRGFFLQNPNLRPLFNVTIAIFPFALAFLALRFTQFKEKRTLKMFAFLLILSLFFGVRFILINGLLYLFVQQIFYREGQGSLLKIGMGCFLLLFLAVLLGKFREGIYNPLYVGGVLFFNLFYGNNFSDTRDFAWILSHWDGEFLYGKSYLSGIISFIPRAYSAFREEWGFSMYTNQLIGFDSEVMPGLRPGYFGEAYINLGIPGVIFFGWLLGFILRYADVQIKEAVRVSKDVIKGYSLTVGFYFLQCLIISASMWMFYVFVLINLALIPFRERTRVQSQTV